MWDTIRGADRLIFQMLTKRSDRMAALLPPFWDEIKHRIWLGVSIENNDYIFRADDLRRLDCAVRFVSYQPAPGPLDKLNLDDLDWIIYGGESGSHYRPEDKQWARGRVSLSNFDSVRRRQATPGLCLIGRKPVLRRMRPFALVANGDAGESGALTKVLSSSHRPSLLAQRRQIDDQAELVVGADQVHGSGSIRPCWTPRVLALRANSINRHGPTHGMG